jgi:hypothetical protein
MLRIARTLPGELQGRINPKDYGFSAVKHTRPSAHESKERVRRLYYQAKERTGIVIPRLESYLRK